MAAPAIFRRDPEHRPPGVTQTRTKPSASHKKRKSTSRDDDDDDDGDDDDDDDYDDDDDDYEAPKKRSTSGRRVRAGASRRAGVGTSRRAGAGAGAGTGASRTGAAATATATATAAATATATAAAAADTTTGKHSRRSGRSTRVVNYTEDPIVLPPKQPLKSSSPRLPTKHSHGVNPPRAGFTMSGHPVAIASDVATNAPLQSPAAHTTPSPLSKSQPTESTDPPVLSASNTALIDTVATATTAPATAAAACDAPSASQPFLPSTGGTGTAAPVPATKPVNVTKPVAALHAEATDGDESAEVLSQPRVVRKLLH